ncbi:TetR/AcrR family transcriptional regulator [Thalassotalea castellviae]|uniref:TetR/AcrR family transcriptional regulator n=1 Tax=Thalassotalea castellviae TaxID=3075612 RepID=A0ABU3A310_9GAMM|nr:TetR/AcrR family transcriptional regulator [Thalassotalea sp. W431]MDT0604534.1 TetR/AcrR family transcriptional regulator [Thalassotalea sp. W431]
MAKAAKFDRQEVIDLATNLYWKKGFNATSMRNLQDEIDMRPGSIYAAFGNKDGLFIETLRNYTDKGISLIHQYEQEKDSPLEALKDFVKYQVITTKEDAPNSMCMLTKTINELTSDNQELLDITKAHIEEISQEFAKLIEQSKELGEINSEKSALELAKYLQVQIAGLRTFAKIDGVECNLDKMINECFDHYPFNA